MTYLDTLFTATYWQDVYLGNTLQAYVLALGVFVVSFIVLKAIQSIVLGRLRAFARKTATDIDDLLISAFKSIRPAFYVVVSVYLALRYLAFAEIVDKVIGVILLLVVIYQVIRMVGMVIDFGIRKKFEGDPGGIGAAKFLTRVVKAILWALGILLVLQNVGVNVTSLIAGLGIGGIAIAFAVQGILEDLFSSFAIFFDKPFQVGDAIKVGNTQGTVKKIGVKTSRLTSPDGEEIVMNNKMLTNAELRNYGSLEERRATLRFGVVYELPQEVLESIPSIVETILEDVEHVRLQRVSFTEFGDSALQFVATYFVESPDYDLFMTKQQEVNMTLRKVFEEKDIGMAYPTQVVYEQKMKK